MKMKKRVSTTLPKDMVDFCKKNKINMSELLNESLINDNGSKEEFVRVNLTVDKDIDLKDKDCAYLLRKAISNIMKQFE